MVYGTTHQRTILSRHIVLHDDMAYNAFRVTGDLLHVIAVCMILYRLFVKKNAQGISLKTQEALLFVSVARYLDLFTTFYDAYNSIVKIFYISSSLFICCSISCLHQLKSTYRPDQDMAAVKSWHYVIATILTFSFSYLISDATFGIDPLEICWTASFIWEPLALIPQAILYRRYRQVEGLTGASFLFLMGLYRFLYIINWMYRANTEKRYKHHLVVYFSGGAQVLIAWYALFWPDGRNEGDMLAAPILAQIIQFCREVYCGILGLLLLFGLFLYAKTTVLDEETAVFVILVTFVGLALLLLTPPACFFYMYCDNSRTSTDVGRADHGDVLDDLTLPLVEQTSEEGAASDDPTIVELTSQPAELQSDAEHETPIIPPKYAGGIQVV
ncbi:ER lumen protein retaining receptor [Fragilaria crotonensis]|nr:ER lumen protein retaining receptor [Fragilaria crotonensis]